jgi:3-methyladenine DNA glycosylase/8-oxoguanine DNA glycosylase
MQGHADAIICRPTPGDHLEQMKGRIDRPGQIEKKLILVVLVAEHTLEEAKFANIHLAGNFFREYIAPVATKYRERVDLEATLAAGGTGKLPRGIVENTWRSSLEAAGQSGAFARIDISIELEEGKEEMVDEIIIDTSPKSTQKKASASKYAPRNKVLRNKGDPMVIQEAKTAAKSGLASLAVRHWLFPPNPMKQQSLPKGLPKDSLLRFSDAVPPVVLDHETVHKAVDHLSRDPTLSALIQRVGAESLIQNIGDVVMTTQASLFDRCLRGITFTMVSIDAGNSFLRKLSIKIGVCLERMPTKGRRDILGQVVDEIRDGNDTCTLTSADLLESLLRGEGGDFYFTATLLRPLIDGCEDINGKRSGYPHLCGGKPVKCGKRDDPANFLQKARDFADGKGVAQVSASYSAPKASFLVALVEDFESGKISAPKILQASDRRAAKMLLDLKGIGDWSAAGVLIHNLKRANIMQYGDLTLRNGLNDLYDINHNTQSETKLESAADLPDNAINRNRIDALAAKNDWEPYRSVLTHLMYHLQEENLVLV